MNLASLKRALTTRDARVVLIHPRLLKRVILVDRGLHGIGFLVPHKLSYLLSRERLLQIVSADEMPSTTLGDTVLLIAEPSERELKNWKDETILNRYWRYLYHLRIHEVIERGIANGTIAPRKIFETLPHHFIQEIKNVLSDDKYLLPPGDDATLLTEFIAVYLELLSFSPNLITVFFPSIEGISGLEDKIVNLVPKDLLEQCKPDGAKKITSVTIEELTIPYIKLPKLPHWLRMHFVQSAQKAESLGNAVRGIVLRARAGLKEEEEDFEIKGSLDAFVRRLEKALHFSVFRAKAWVDALMPVTRFAAFGLVRQECRFLFDLQRVCLDAERQSFSVNLFPWILSLGKVPLRRPLPNEQKVRIFRRLQRAFKRIPKLKITQEEKENLELLILEALRTCEGSLRDSFRPMINEAFEQGALKPKNAPDRIALNKLCEELLDRVIAKGHLVLGDLRDAVSRNDLKLPDIQTPYELIGGDPLLRVDSALAKLLDGVYHRGEVYIRALQGFTSLMFGIPLGRLLTRFVFLPFGGSFLLLSGIQHVFGEWEKRITGIALQLDSPINVIGVGIPIAFLVNSSRAREMVGNFFGAIGKSIRFIFIEIPKFLLSIPLIREIFEYRIFRYMIQFLVKPLIVTCIIWVLLPRIPSLSSHDPFKATAIFLGLVTLFNSRGWSRAEEIMIDWITRSWKWFSRDFLQGLFDSIMEFFRQVTTVTERLIYWGDELLRFRSGEGRIVLGFKAILGTLWSIVAYLTRFAIRLLLEPQVNPIKHFPVVTVSHKLLLPTIPLFVEPLRALGYTKPEAIGLATTVIFCIPGIFGFLVWELRENWRLYEANRTKSLTPVPIDYHGHSIPNLLLPGFHSGVIPKVFRRLRSLWRKDGSRAAKRRDNLDHKLEDIRIAIARFTSRLFLFEEEGMPKGIRVERIGISTNSIGINLAFHDEAGPLLITLHAANSGIVAKVVGLKKWEDFLNSEENRIFDGLLDAFLSWSGVTSVCKDSSPDNNKFTAFKPLSWASWVNLWSGKEGKAVGAKNGKGVLH